MVDADFLKYAMLGFFICWSTKAIFFLVAILLMVVLALLVIFITVCLIWFVTKFAYWEIVTAWRDYRRPSATFASPWPHWEVVGQLRTSSNEIIERVTQWDADPIDDPLHPHASIVYVVGIQRRNSFWRTITLWRVSTLTSERKRVCYFTYIDPNPFLRTIEFKVYAFERRGVVFVHVRNVKEFGKDHGSLLVYDIRYKEPADLKLLNPVAVHCHPLTILCLGRRMKQQSVKGWRIRFLALGGTFNDAFERRAVISNVVADVSASDSKPFEILSHEDLLFPFPDAGVELLPSAGKVGVQDQGTRIFVYYLGTNRFEHCPSLAAFVNSDEVFKKYYAKHPVMAGNLWRTFPGAITDREVVLKMTNEPVLIRTSLQPPTLLMLAARALFKADPKVAKLDVAQFCEMTGVDLSGHLS